MPAEHLMSSPTLAELLHGYADAPPIPISGIASDSRQLGNGYLFLACQGMSSHGLDYLDEALAAGVLAVAYDASTATAPADVEIPVVGVEGLGEKLGEIANRFYGRPSESLRVIGVTGTNGKTSVAWLTAQCAQMLGKRCGYLGTLGFGIDELQGEEGMTTPAAIELHGRLADFVVDDARYAAIEVSSHALAQGRVDGVRFEAALFTNLSRDHLDYHADMNDYFETKARLFLDCGARHRIVNVDSEWGTQLATRCGEDVVIVSTRTDRTADGRPHVFVRSAVAGPGGSAIEFASSWGDGRYESPLPGDFNVANSVIALALMLRLGVPVEDACGVLSRVSAPPGRMQRVPGEGAAVFVDYAHTPGALEVVLQALRIHCRGKLWCVFGCGGDRDAGKRPLMGRAAERFADGVVVTSDNPRNEPAMAIIDDIVTGLARPEQVTVIDDRAAAIVWTVRQAAADDVVLIAGKGHENYQDVGGERRTFSDIAVAAAALSGSAGRGAR